MHILLQSLCCMRPKLFDKISKQGNSKTQYHSSERNISVVKWVMVMVQLFDGSLEPKREVNLNIF